MNRAQAERAIRELSVGLPKPGATAAWPCANSPTELLIAQHAARARGAKVGVIIGPYYSQSPAARRCREDIDRLMER